MAEARAESNPRTFARRAAIWAMLTVVYLALRLQGGGCLSFAFLCGDILIPIAGLIVLVRSQKWRPVAGIVVAMEIVVFAVHLPLIEHQREKSRRTGEQIAAAVEAFRRDKGAYPDALKELVPDYLPKLPRTSIGLFGGKYYYSKQEVSPLDGKPRFSLGFGSPRGPTERGLLYWSDWKGWGTWKM